METKHTPGPWKAYSPSSNRLGNVPIGTDNVTVAIVLTSSSAQDTELIVEKTWYANAKLIAAAPDLLKALDELQYEVQMQCSIGSDPRFLKMLELWQNAKQAINKATN